MLPLRRKLVQQRAADEGDDRRLPVAVEECQGPHLRRWGLATELIADAERKDALVAYTLELLDALVLRDLFVKVKRDHHTLVLPQQLADAPHKLTLDIFQPGLLLLHLQIREACAGLVFTRSAQCSATTRTTPERPLATCL